VRVAILLAAGRSRRMGRDKLTLGLDGETVLERSLQNLLDAGVDLVRLVVSPGFEPDDVRGVSDRRVTTVTNPEPEIGLSSSLRTGARNLPEGTNVVLITLADAPLVEASTIRQLVDAFEGLDARIVFPTFRGKQGHPVLWDVSLVPELASIEGDRGAKSVVERHRHEAHAVPLDDPGVCFDIDTPEDYARARELLQKKKPSSE